MLNDNAGETGALPVTVQETEEISSPNNPVEAKAPAPEKGDQEPNAETKGDEVEKEKSSKPEQFNRHPAFQRLSRKNAKMSATVEAQKGQITELSGMVKEMLALQKGEEFTPEAKVTNNSLPDPQELLDMEMDKLLEKEDLGSEEEAAVIKIAKQYAHEVGEGKVYLPAATALKIYRDSSGSAKPSIPTKPSAKASERNVADMKTVKEPAKDVYEAARRAKARLAQMGHI